MARHVPRRAHRDGRAEAAPADPRPRRRPPRRAPADAREHGRRLPRQGARVLLVVPLPLPVPASPGEAAAGVAAPVLPIRRHGLPHDLRQRRGGRGLSREATRRRHRRQRLHRPVCHPHLPRQRHHPPHGPQRRPGHRRRGAVRAVGRAVLRSSRRAAARARRRRRHVPLPARVVRRRAGPRDPDPALRGLPLPDRRLCRPQLLLAVLASRHPRRRLLDPPLVRPHRHPLGHHLGAVHHHGAPPHPRAALPHLGLLRPLPAHVPPRHPHRHDLPRGAPRDRGEDQAHARAGAGGGAGSGSVRGAPRAPGAPVQAEGEQQPVPGHDLLCHDQLDVRRRDHQLRRRLLHLRLAARRRRQRPRPPRRRSGHLRRLQRADHRRLGPLLRRATPPPRAPRRAGPRRSIGLDGPTGPPRAAGGAGRARRPAGRVRGRDREEQGEVRGVPGGFRGRADVCDHGVHGGGRTVHRLPGKHVRHPAVHLPRMTLRRQTIACERLASRFMKLH